MKNKGGTNYIYFLLIFIMTTYACASINFHSINHLNTHGNRSGYWVHTDSLNMICLAHYKNGQINGIYKEFFPDGKMACTGKYKYGKKSGTWHYYLSDGQCNEIEKYKSGVLKKRVIRNIRF